MAQRQLWDLSQKMAEVGMMIKQSCVQALSDEIAQHLHNAILACGEASLAVSGGSTPIELFKQLSMRDIEWRKVSVLLCDERCVSSLSHDSNAWLVKEYLLQNRASMAQFLPLYDDVSIETSLQNAPKNKKIDVLILGMGMDGHTASLFPNNEKLEEAYDAHNKTSYLHITPSSAPYERISMSLETILGANHIYVHIEGEQKREVLTKAIDSGDRYTYPIISVLNHPNKKVSVYST